MHLWTCRCLLAIVPYRVGPVTQTVKKLNVDITFSECHEGLSAYKAPIVVQTKLIVIPDKPFALLRFAQKS